MCACEGGERPIVIGPKTIASWLDDSGYGRCDERFCQEVLARIADDVCELACERASDACLDLMDEGVPRSLEEAREMERMERILCL